MNEKKLPSLVELYEDTEMVVKRSELNVLLNQPPNPKWILKHPIIKKEIINQEGRKEQIPYEYIPIEKLQWLMNRIFGGYKLEVLNYNLIANSVAVHVRITYKDVLTNDLLTVDGVGAVALQTEKNFGAVDFNHLRSSAVQMALPAAKSFAEKDAISSIGRLFGRDINRADETLYMSVREQVDKLEIENASKELSKLINYIENDDVRNKYMEKIAAIEFSDNLPNIEQYEQLINELKGLKNV